MSVVKLFSILKPNTCTKIERPIANTRTLDFFLDCQCCNAPYLKISQHFIYQCPINAQISMYLYIACSECFKNIIVKDVDHQTIHI